MKTWGHELQKANLAGVVYVASLADFDRAGTARPSRLLDELDLLNVVLDAMPEMQTPVATVSPNNTLHREQH